MIMCALLNCALEGTRGAWTQRLNCASLKDKKNSRGGNLNWSELVSFNILFSSGGGIRSLQTGGDLGARGVLCRLPCLAKFPQHCCFFFFEIPIKVTVIPPSFCLWGWVTPCWVAAPSLCSRIPCTAPGERLLLRLSPSLVGRDVYDLVRSGAVGFLPLQRVDDSLWGEET